MATSFKKKTCRGRPCFPLGTKPSLYNNQLLTSSGCPSLDSLVGGGLAVGTLVLLEEDAHGCYADVLKKYFIAEGVFSQHCLYLGSISNKLDDVLRDIPKDVNEGKYYTDSRQEHDDLQIAWRYKNQSKLHSPILPTATPFGHYFDLSNTLTEEKIDFSKWSSFLPTETHEELKKCNKIIYHKLLKSIRETIIKENLIVKNSMVIPNILRIELSLLGSPLWSEPLIASNEYDESLVSFLLALRSLLRKSYATAIVSIPSHIFEEYYFLKRIEHCCDVVIKLESFASLNKSQNSIFKEYHGLLHLKKVPHINSICSENIDMSDLAFKVKRKKFVIEKLHLPPEHSETVSRSISNTSTLKHKIHLCSQTTGNGALLDF